MRKGWGWERGRARVSLGVVGGGGGQSWVVNVIGVQRCCYEGYLMYRMIISWFNNKGLM